MHPKVLPPKAWTLVRALVREGLTVGWTLAGGTGLALQLGHRLSEDLDFFRAASFQPENLVTALTRTGRVHVQARSAGTLHASIEGLRVSFLSAQSPLLFPGTAYRGLVLADPRDIAVMKVIAIGGRGSRKDFIVKGNIIFAGQPRADSFICHLGHKCLRALQLNCRVKDTTDLNQL